MAEGSSLASRNALRITRQAPSPSSGGEVTWKASALIP